MPTWRFVARFKPETSSLERTTPYQAFLESEQEGFEKLKEFLEGRKKEFGANLRWLALERAEYNVEYNDPNANWQEMKRLFPD